MGRRPRPGTRSLRSTAALLLVACLAVPPPQPAAVQAPDPSPSARELRETYPLHPSPQPGTGERPAVTAVPSGRPRAGQSSQPSPNPVIAAALVILAFAAGCALALRYPRRRSPGDSQSSADPVAVAPTALPPATSRSWTAEIEWRPTGGEACFRVIARPAGGTATAVVAESARVKWPPSDAAAVPTLTAAAEELETRLVAAGWRPLPPGDAWYAKRFAWEPVAATRGRFDRAHTTVGEQEDEWIDKDGGPKTSAGRAGDS